MRSSHWFHKDFARNGTKMMHGFHYGTFKVMVDGNTLIDGGRAGFLRHAFGAKIVEAVLNKLRGS